MTNRLSISTSTDVMNSTLKKSIFEDPSFELYSTFDTKSVDSSSSSGCTTSCNDDRSKYQAIAQLDIENKKNVQSDGFKIHRPLARTNTMAYPQLAYQPSTTKPLLRHSLSMPVQTKVQTCTFPQSPIRLRSTGEQLFNAVPSSPYSPCNYSPQNFSPSVSNNSKARITMSQIVDFAKPEIAIRNRKSQSLKEKNTKLCFEDSFDDILPCK